MLIKYNNFLLIKIKARKNACWGLCFTKFEDNALLICNKKNLTCFLRLFDITNNKFIDLNKFYNQNIISLEISLKNKFYSIYAFIDININYNLLINNIIYLINKHYNAY